MRRPLAVVVIVLKRLFLLLVAPLTGLVVVDAVAVAYWGKIMPW